MNLLQVKVKDLETGQDFKFAPDDRDWLTRTENGYMTAHRMAYLGINKVRGFRSMESPVYVETLKVSF